MQQDRWDEFVDRWESDPSFRRSGNLLFGGILAVLLVILFSGGLILADRAIGLIFPAGNSLTTNHTRDPVAITTDKRFPIATAASAGQTITPTPERVPASTFLFPTATPKPTATALPPPTPTITPDPSLPVPPANCPPLTTYISAGQSVRASAYPAPLQGGCPAAITLNASRLPNASVDIVLVFGVLNPAGCSVHITGVTDSQGRITLPFTVPGSLCFVGSITTTGTITVGSDSTTPASFPAKG